MLEKFVTYFYQGTRCYGIARDEGVVNLSSLYPQYPDLKAVISAGALAELAKAARDLTPSTTWAEVRFDIPLHNPEKILCVGVNYPDRNAEYRDGQQAPEKPSLFIRFPRSFVGHNEALVRPKISEQLDYEGEIALIIGREGRAIPAAEAYHYIAGLTLCNEGSIRDWIRHGKFNVTQGKNFDASGSLGPWFIPFQSPAQLEDIPLETRVNGQIRQKDRTSQMIFNFSTLISYISTFTTLVPGDIIITGTPTGSGARLDPPQWLKAGDVVEVEAEGLGCLRNSVILEAE